MTILFGLLLVICMLAMWIALMAGRYLLSSVFFLLSTSSLFLLIAPRLGYSFKVVLASIGVVALSLAIGAFNYWLRRYFVNWLKARREKNRQI